MGKVAAFLFFAIASVSGLPAPLDDILDQTNYRPDQQNVYHLFTRLNREVSQPLLMGSEGLLGITNFDARRRTIIILHSWRQSATSPVNRQLVPAFLDAEDLNVIVVDWSAGASDVIFGNSVANSVSSGQSVARFVNWLNTATGSTAANYHIVGHGLGGHQAGVIGRNVVGDVTYITALDPSFFLWNNEEAKLRDTDAVYVEVIHTNAGINGYLFPLGHVDFFPNRGTEMPGCDSHQCSHEMSFHYMAESLRSGGFTGRRCATHVGAVTGNCVMLGTLRMGGLVPKIGQSGIFGLETNARPPFSRS